MSYWYTNCSEGGSFCNHTSLWLLTLFDTIGVRVCQTARKGLKSKGNIFSHCSDTQSGYLKSTVSYICSPQNNKQVHVLVFPSISSKMAALILYDSKSATNPVCLKILINLSCPNNTLV